MPLISEETILEVQRSVDIYEVVSGYIPLKRAGTNYKGLCPFHEEKTPSFNVHPERQIYKCFGCGKGGSVFTFVMEHEKVTFPEAITMLAEKAGIRIKYQGGGKQGPDKTDVYRILDWAAKHYHRLLVSHPAGEGARKYAKDRGLTQETIETWAVGYAKDSWDDLVTSARKQGFPDGLLVTAGLARERKSGSGIYDYFRSRLVFPVRDIRGRVVGFGGRALGDAEPKYLNSPEMPVFSKSRLLYGLDVAKEDAADRKTLFVVEGYFDVVLPWQAGVAGMVAPLGTALTKDHLSLLRRYAEKVVLVFDSDSAGQRAAERSLDLLLGEDLDLFVARMPAGKDPADLVMEMGAEKFRALLGEPVEIFQFLVDSLEERLGGDTPATRTRVIEEMADRIAQVPNAIKRELLIQQLAGKYRIPETTIRARIGKPAGNEQAAAASKELTTDERIGRELIQLMLEGSAILKRLVQIVPPERFPTEGTRKVAEKIFSLYRKEGEVRAADLVSLMQDQAETTLVADILTGEAFPEKVVDAKIAGILEYLESREYKERAATLKEGQDVNERLRGLAKRGVRNPRQMPRG